MLYTHTGKHAYPKVSMIKGCVLFYWDPEKIVDKCTTGEMFDLDGS